MKKMSSIQVFILLLVFVILLLIITYTIKAHNSSPTSVFQKQTLQTKPIPTIPESITPQVTSTLSISPEDITAKNSLLDRILHGINQSGIVYQSPDVQMQYIASDNIFQAEISTTQITSAKRETENWLHTQGISQKGICKLLFFYINPEIRVQLPESASQVNLLPGGC